MSSFYKSRLLLLYSVFAMSFAKEQTALYDLSFGGVDVGYQRKPHLNISFYEIGLPLGSENLFISAPMATIAVSPIFSRDTHHMSLNVIPSLAGAAYLLLADDPSSRKSKVLFGILAAPHLLTNLKLTAYAGRFDFSLRQKTDFHLIDKTKRGVYSECNAGIGVNLFRDWCIGLYGALPVLKNLPYKPQKPYLGVKVYLNY